MTINKCIICDIKTNDYKLNYDDDLYEYACTKCITIIINKNIDCSRYTNSVCQICSKKSYMYYDFESMYGNLYMLILCNNCIQLFKNI